MVFGHVRQAQHRKHLRRLAERDAANRCAVCKIALTGRRLRAMDCEKSFCSTDCLADYLAGFHEKGRA